jgi:hypothetical protein
MTAQVPEELILDGEKVTMVSCPPLPVGHPRIIMVAPDEIAGDDVSPVVFSTACWRGYIGTWEIKDGKFYLVSLRGRYKLLGEEPVLADWFTGVLVIPRGELLQYVHLGFESVYEQEMQVKIEKGVVIETRVIDNR